MPRRIRYYRPPGLGQAHNAYERSDARAEDKRFYCAARWRRLRAWFLAEHPLCEDCKTKGLLTAAEHVHHKVERKADPDRALDPTNLEALCEPCHGARRARGTNA